jgi:hypothetical protein
MRNTLIAFLLCTAEVGFAQTLLDTTTVHGIGAKSCGEYLSAVSDHAPGTGMTVKQADVDYFDAATVQSEWLAAAGISARRASVSMSCPRSTGTTPRR